MSPSLRPTPGTRWRITITEITPDGDEDEFLEFTGDAYVVATATVSGTRITSDVDHNGDLPLRERLVAYLATSVYDAGTR